MVGFSNNINNTALMIPSDRTMGVLGLGLGSEFVAAEAIAFIILAPIIILIQVFHISTPVVLWLLVFPFLVIIAALVEVKVLGLIGLKIIPVAWFIFTQFKAMLGFAGSVEDGEAIKIELFPEYKPSMMGWGMEG